MRNRVHAGRGKSVAVEEAIDGGRGPHFLRSLGWGPRDAVAFLAAALAAAAILANVLFLQPGAHPAPMFRGARAPTSAVTPKPSVALPAPRARPVESAPAATPGKASVPRTPGEIINDIQRELARRGYYDGAVDGLYGPKTDSAIRDFEHAAGLKPSQEPNEALLHAIMRSPARAVRGPAVPAVRPPTAIRPEVAQDRAAPSRRVVALQRALAEYGYGQIKPTGVVDAETQAAIEKFERERKLPITGQASDRVVRELAAMTGRPLE